MSDDPVTEWLIDCFGATTHELTLDRAPGPC
jgi:hypothetical protein